MTTKVAPAEPQPASLRAAGAQRPRSGSVITTADALERLVAAYTEFDEFAFDTETKGEHPLDPRRNVVFWLSLAGPGRADAIPFGHPLGRMLTPPSKYQERYPDPDGAVLKSGKPKMRSRTVHVAPVFALPPSQLAPATVFSALKPLFFSERRKVGHNLKFDLQSVAKYFGEPPPPPYGDTMIARHLLNENLKRYDLLTCCQRDLKASYDKLGKRGVHTVPFYDAARYATLDAKYTWLLWCRYRDALSRAGLDGVMKLEMDVLEVLVHMELEGVPVDFAAVEELDRDLRERMTTIEKRVFKVAGRVINLDANTEVAEFIYGDRKHKVREFTPKKQQPSTTAKALKAYASRDPVVADIMEWKTYKKLQATYIEGQIRWINRHDDDGDDGIPRLHACFNQHVTVTGRFSCSEPNLQNIPRPDKPHAKKIRGLFIAPPGCKLIVADYAQQEYRVLAHFSQDRRYLRIFREGKLDPHVLTAVELFGLDPSEVTPQQRTIAKNTGFALSYGAEAPRLAEMSGISIRKAEEVMRRHAETFPGVHRWINQTIRDCRRRRPPHVTTILGRKRRLPEICAQNRSRRREAERQAVNTVIQGSAADITKLAMVRAHRMLPEDCPQVLTVHDEIVVVSPNDRVEEATVVLREAMENIDLLSVALKADVKVVERWSEAK